MQTNCGNCDWHTKIDHTAGKRNTYCEYRLAWVSIDGTCEHFKTFDYSKGDSERRAAANQHKEGQDRRTSLTWQKIAVFIAAVVAILAIISLLML